MFLHDYLLHHCLYLTEFEDREIRMDRYSLREILSKWLDSLTDSVLWKIRPRLLTTTLEFVERKPSPDALFVVTGIGYRSKETVHTLKRIVERDDITGDTALRLLVGIRVQGADLGWVRKRLDERFQSGNPSFELLFAMSILVGEGVIERLLEVGIVGGQNWHIFHRFGLLCNLVPGDRDYQDRIWGAIETLANSRDNGWRELLFCGGVVEECQTPKVVESMVSHLSRIVRDGAVHFLGNRFEAFDSPIHANAAKQLRPTVDVAELEPIAVRPSDSQDRMMTAQNYEQNYAWEISLFLGSAAVLDWIPAAVDHETNKLMQHRLMERMAVLSCPNLPRRAISLLTDPALSFKRGGNEPEILPFLAACRLVASSPSFKSLDMLLDVAGLIDGFPFRSPLEDGAELASWLYAQQGNSIIDRLITAANAEGIMGKGIALRALGQIAGKIGCLTLGKLWPIACDPS